MQRGGIWLSKDAMALALQDERAQAQRGPQGEDGAGDPDGSPVYDVVVVGSGYGGAVAAARLSALAEAPGGRALRVAVLERGAEYTPGSFPDRFSDLVGHLRMQGANPLGAPANPEGLFDWHLDGDVGALVANGLGGGSLINAGVCEPAQPGALARADWPEPWRGNRPLWTALYARASDALGARPWPAQRVAKQAAMADLADRLCATPRPVWLAIAPPADADPDGSGRQGPVPMAPCLECGDCFTGCNVNAKRTLGHNYLARARAQGADLFTGATVRHVERLPPLPPGEADGPDVPRWQVHWRPTDPLRLPTSQQLFRVRARHVVIAAGTFGSTEILMRSREAGLPVSGRLGDGFSANGDVLSATHDTGKPVGISPDENLPLAERRAGPTITTQLHWPATRADQHLAPLHTLQDLTVPGALGWVFAEVLTSMMVPQRWTRWNFATEDPGDRDRFAVDPAAIGRSLLTVAYVDDGARGRLEPGVGWASATRDGALRVRWKDVGTIPQLWTMDARLLAATPPGGEHLRNPLWQFMPKRAYLGLEQTDRRLLTVHPLGGCRMGATARDGVVDPWGRVFDCGGMPANLAEPRAEADRTARSGLHDRKVHPGLAVLDGSIVPTALGINPLLTITALAEGAIDHWQQQERWVAASPRDTQPPPLQVPDLPATRPMPMPTAIRFKEVMEGRVEKVQTGTPQRSALAGPLPPSEENRPLRLRLQMAFGTVDDLPAFLAQPHKQLPVEGTFVLSRRREPVVATGAADDENDTAYDEVCRAPLQGTVRWLAIERSTVGQRFWRVARTYLATRWQADRADAERQHTSLTEGLVDKLRGATHFGAIRQLAYRFEVVRPELLSELGLDTERNFTLHGTKRVGYRLSSCRDPESANPWRQLGEMTLWARPERGHRIALGTLKFQDMAALDRQGLPLALLRQADGVAGVRDMVRLGLYFGRMLFGLHMFSFRRADYAAEAYGPRGLERLPPLAYAVDDARFAGLCVERHPVAVPQVGAPPLTLLLTRVHRPGATTGLPVLLVHGFGSGGVQFTHPAIPQPMAPWLARQGHDVWVAELRTSIGLDSHRLQWSMDQVAKQDIPALVRAVCEHTGQPQAHVVAHCIGSAMFCMAMLQGALHTPQGSRVASAALLQVGPRVQLPTASRARAFIALRLRQFLGAAEAHSVASQDIDDMEALLDRLCGSYLYPAAERRHYRLSGNLRRNTQRVNANRSAVIFGQLFQHANMTPCLLNALPDLLGSCNLTTYEQTAQYAYEHRLTNQSGEDVYTSQAHLQQHFNLPVLLLHGEENRTFHPDTLMRNVREFTAAGLPVRSVLVPGFGHLDCVVGRGADSAVFQHIHDHLADAARQPPRGVPPAPDHTAPVVRLPRVGPWLGDVQPDPVTGGLRLRFGLRIDEPGRRQPLLGVATLLCDAQGQPLANFDRHTLEAGRHEQVLEVVVALPPATGAMPAGAAAGHLKLLVAAVHGAWPANAAQLAEAVAERRERLSEEAGRHLIEPKALDGLQLDLDWLRRMAQPDADRLGLVLGSCRQRPMLTDRPLADASMGGLVAALNAPADAQPDGHAPIDLVLLAGDQVYADLRVDTGHTSAQRRQYFEAHQEAWTARWQREVLRRRPVVMALDDHEFRNDYNNLVARGRAQEFHAAATAWQRYQLAAGPRQPEVHPALPGAELKAAWRALDLCGFHFFVCDTRSERDDTARVDRRGARIMSDLQMDALLAWLRTPRDGASHGDRPKVVVTGSPVAPLFRNAQGHAGAATSSDGWQRFPDSLDRLLHWIANEEIDNVLFLSGDYHLHADVTLQLQAPGKRKVQARSIVTGGLYSPLPVANATRGEFLDGPGAQGLRAGPTTWGYAITASVPGSGHTRLTLDRAGGVRASFEPAPVLRR